MLKQFQRARKNTLQMRQFLNWQWYKFLSFIRIFVPWRLRYLSIELLLHLLQRRSETHIGYGTAPTTTVLTLRLRTTLVILSKNGSLQYSWHHQCNSHTYTGWTATFAGRFMPVKIRDDAVGKDDCTSRISTGSAWIFGCKCRTSWHKNGTDAPGNDLWEQAYKFWVFDALKSRLIVCSQRQCQILYTRHGAPMMEQVLAQDSSPFTRWTSLHRKLQSAVLTKNLRYRLRSMPILVCNKKLGKFVPINNTEPGFQEHTTETLEALRAT